MLQILSPSLLLTALLGFVPSASVAQEKAPLAKVTHLEKTAQLYGVKDWPAGAMRDGLLLGHLTLPGYVGAPLDARQGFLTRTFKPEKAADGARPTFLVEARVCDSVVEAREQLTRWLAGVNSAGLVPRVQPPGSIGEVAFQGRSGAGPKALSWVALVRGNVAIRVLNLYPRKNPDLNLIALASQLDGAALSRPILPEQVSLAKPSIALLQPARTAVTAGERIVLEVEALDSLQSQKEGQADALSPTLRWRTSGTATGYVEQRGGQWVLFTTGPGTLKVTLEATGSNGTWSEKTTSLTVRDDD